MELIKDIWNDSIEGKFIVGLIAALMALIPLVIYSAAQDAKEWESFKVSHSCKVVSKEKGSMTTGVAPIIGGNGGIGVVVATTPDKTGWLCDDEVTYWR